MIADAGGARERGVEGMTGACTEVANVVATQGADLTRAGENATTEPNIHENVITTKDKETVELVANSGANSGLDKPPGEETVGGEKGGSRRASERGELDRRIEEALEAGVESNRDLIELAMEASRLAIESLGLGTPQPP